MGGGGEQWVGWGVMEGWGDTSTEQDGMGKLNTSHGGGGVQQLSG